MQRQLPVTVLALVVIAQCVGLPQERVRDPKLGLVFSVPEPWRVLDPGLSPISIANFRQAQRLKAAILPAVGAMITVFEPSQSVRGCPGWVGYIRRRHETARVTNGLDSGVSGQPAPAGTVIDYRPSGEDRGARTSGVCVERHGRAIVVSLTYFERDERSAEDRSIQHGVVRSRQVEVRRR